MKELSTKVRITLDIIVIILLFTSLYFLWKEIYYIKEHGGECVNNPMRWAEQYAIKEKGKFINCYCEENLLTINYTKLNMTGG